MVLFIADAREVLAADVGEAVAAANQPSPPSTPTEGQPVAEVRFRGLNRVDSGYALSLIRTRSGDPYAASAVTEDTDRLFRTGKFDDVTAAATMEDGKLVVTFSVTEHPVVEAVEVLGNRKFKTQELIEAAELSVGAPISDYTIKRAVDAIERKYREAGYHYATVQLDEQALRAENRVLLTISEGPRVRVRKIEFVGNTAYDAATLKGKIETKTWIWIFRKGDLDMERLERDAVKLAEFYRDDGYLDAEVSFDPPEFSADQEEVTVRFIIKEGPRYRIRNRVFSGFTVWSPDEMAADANLRLTPGQPLIAERLRADVKTIRDKYGQAGYIYAGVRPEWVYAAEPELIDLTFTIQEGEQFRIGRIIVRGNQRTQDKVVRRELGLGFQPTQLYDAVAAERGQNRLRESRLFEMEGVSITPVGEAPGVRDALVQVEETDTTNLLFGVGVTSNSGVIGNVSIENRNFDLFDWPRNWTEFFKGRSFRGAGQVLRLQVEPGTTLSRARIDFREPWLGDRPIGYNQGLYYFERGYPEYDEERVGINTSFDRRFQTGPLRDWAAEIALRIEHIDVGGLDFFSDEDFKDVEGGNWLTSVKGTLLRNTTDSIFLPTRGSSFRISSEQAGALGGDFTFNKVIIDYSRFFTLHTDVLERKHILAIGGTVGNIFGDAPPFERFHAGGIGSIRGFEYRGISPRGGFLLRDDERIGGDALFLVNTEYTFPLMGKVVRGVTFLDMGTVEENFGISDWRAAVGFGLRIYIPFFGPIPMSFDFGWPIASDGDDDTQVFSFSFGTTF